MIYKSWFDYVFPIHWCRVSGDNVSLTKPTNQACILFVSRILSDSISSVDVFLFILGSWLPFLVAQLLVWQEFCAPKVYMSVFPPKLLWHYLQRGCFWDTLLAQILYFLCFTIYHVGAFFRVWTAKVNSQVDLREGERSLSIKVWKEGNGC